MTTTADIIAEFDRQRGSAIANRTLRSAHKASNMARTVSNGLRYGIAAGILTAVASVFLAFAL